MRTASGSKVAPRDLPALDSTDRDTKLSLRMTPNGAARTSAAPKRPWAGTGRPGARGAQEDLGVVRRTLEQDRSILRAAVERAAWMTGRYIALEYAAARARSAADCDYLPSGGENERHLGDPGQPEKRPRRGLR